MNRDIFESALIELDALLARPNAPELEFQDWFERHSVVFLNLGFSRAIPHPEIRGTADRKWIPDFLVQRPNGTWSVLELKRADQEVLPNSDRRVTFYSDIHKYIAQCAEYVDQFDELAVRDEFGKRYGVQVHKDPKVILVVGRSANLDRDAVRTLSNRQSIEIFTYDDIRSAIYSARAAYFAVYDGARGCSFVVVLRIDKPSADVNNYILDIGADRARNRATVTIDPANHLSLVILDSNGDRHQTRSTLPLTDDQFGQPHSLLFTVGLADTFSFVSVEMDRRYIADVQLQQCPFRLSIDTIIGSDFDGMEAGWLEIGSLVFVTHVLSLEEKTATATYAAHCMGVMQADGRNPLLWLRGREALWSATHPNRAAFDTAFAQVSDFVAKWDDPRSDGTATSGPTLLGGRRVAAPANHSAPVAPGAI
jgi:hypothetical protein